MIKTTNSRGFTLIELLVSISIIAILSAIGVVSYVNANQSSRNSRRQTDIEQVRSALEIYRTDNGSYPSGNTSTDLATINGLNSYLGGSTTITDPKGPPYVYNYLPSPGGCTTACTGYTITYFLEPDSESLLSVTNP